MQQRSKTLTKYKGGRNTRRRWKARKVRKGNKESKIRDSRKKAKEKGEITQEVKSSKARVML
jgi:hypothetical protein